MLYTREMVRDNIRNRDGKRVFYQGSHDQLTSDARDWLRAERIEILPASQAKPDRWKLPGGGYMEEKPEHMTHLDGNTLVSKTHPRIAFRGAMDALEAELLLCCLQTGEKRLNQVLEQARLLLRCDVLAEPVPEVSLGGMTAASQPPPSGFLQSSPFYAQHGGQHAGTLAEPSPVRGPASGTGSGPCLLRC